MRRAVARTVTQSKKSIPHFYATGEADVTDLAGRLRRFRQSDSPVHVTITAALVFALASALGRHPRLNGHWTDDALQVSDSINIGVAIPVRDGLVAPAIIGCESLRVNECAQHLEDLKTRVAGDHVRREEYANATVTLSNLGGTRVRSFSAIIVPPQVAIVAVGSAGVRPSVVGGKIMPRTKMSITTSADHRAVDGLEVAGFLDDLIETLESPEWLGLP
ncbi:MAG: 2-oxo acid dehydrogenase subunit E2 [Acidimicrobiia bacterium]|jgi:pyruvate dehydrogenase E2 component (dihydrolipoamide acetyltransferase)